MKLDVIPFSHITSGPVISESGRIMVVVEYGYISFWSLEDRELISSTQIDAINAEVAILAGEKFAIVTHLTNGIAVIDIATGSIVYSGTLGLENRGESAIISLDINADQPAVLAVSYSNGSIAAYTAPAPLYWPQQDLRAEACKALSAYSNISPLPSLGISDTAFMRENCPAQ